MSDFAVIAELPMGVYRARTPGQSLDPLPSPARLHAALLCAAGAGVRADAGPEGLHPCPADIDALTWIEHNPPDGVRLPPTLYSRTASYAWRRDGAWESRPTGPQEAITQRPVVGVMAVAEPFAWTWRAAPPEQVKASLQSLCVDVAHLGSAETPVRLRVGSAVPTHRRAPDADLFSTPDGLDLDVADAQRTAALIDAYDTQRRAPSPAQDRFSTSESVRSAGSTMIGLRRERYLPPATDDGPPSPWHTALLARLGSPTDRVADEAVVAWATAAHRALISLVGDGAPSLLTGTYDASVPRPANHVAIQLLRGAAVTTAGLEAASAVLVIMLPRAADPGDLAVIQDAFGRLRRVSWRSGHRTLHPLPPRSAASFWPQRAEPLVFRTDPAAVPDGRPVDRSWTIADAVALSLGHVLRDRAELRGAGRGGARSRDTAERVRAAGLHVRSVERVVTGRLSRYVHKMEPTQVVQPYRAELSLGGLVSDRALVCLGQSRHLGGGLLVPCPSDLHAAG